MVQLTQRLLVKAKALPQGAGFSVASVPLRMEPLYPEQHAAAAAQGLTAPAIWHIATLPPGAQGINPWDLCHKLQTGGLGVAGAPQVEFAEPDIQQDWIIDTSERRAAKAFRATAAADSCTKPDVPDGRYPAPNPYDWRWFQDGNHSGLGNARSQVGDLSDRVVIAHLDTGYRKGHAVLPKFMEREHCFVDGSPENDASDPGVTGFGDNPGHGTGTLSILAGSLFKGSVFGAPDGEVGGAPFARIIPVRVANSVVSFANSAIAKGILYAIANGADVLSMSMGGVASQAWVDAVNQAYEAGLLMVTAAGNNFGAGPLRVPRFIVYPARFGRVVAACGVMSDGTPYADFGDPRKMAGSYGPDSKMDTAVAAYTPNTAWAKYACDQIVDFDGAGTSAATPQVAAAAACWLQKNRAAVKAYPEAWMRPQAARQALFDSANNTNREHFGRGTLRALEALKAAPAAAASLKKQGADSLTVPILGPAFHALFGAASNAAKERMLHVEAAQILTRNGELQKMLVDAGVDPDQPPADLSPALRKQFADAMASDPAASETLKTALGKPAAGSGPVAARPAVTIDPTIQTSGENPVLPPPLTRKLRVFAFDPILGLRVDTESINETTMEVPWEHGLQSGPVGEYLEVVDVDPASNVAYAPVDLNHPYILASNGLDPSEGVPQFHQQMVYAVAMTTIGRFEEALGRTALWAPRLTKANGQYQSLYVQRLRIYPHALREQNAFYSPPKKSLLFGYFQANRDNAGDNLPGGLVFSCLSHDVVAHETTHALLDGVHRYYQNQTNPDMAAFHEAFADIVALFQHFTMPAALKHTISKLRGNLGVDNLLAQLAQQFGQASNGSRALRSALATPASVNDYANATEAHDRGAVLVAAVFQAFLEIYHARITDLKRLATGGTGVLPPGDISVDLVNRMAQEASLAASHVLTTCIRALDYCPPLDLTFGEYLRALITADMDVEPEDEYNYRTAFISGFRARGIFPVGVRNMSEESLRWRPPSFNLDPPRIRELLGKLDLQWDLSADRKESYLKAEANGETLWRWLQNDISAAEAAVAEADLGVYLRPGDHVPAGVPLNDGVPVLQIHSVRPARRTSRRGQQIVDLIIEGVQRYIAKDENGFETVLRGGFTVVIDMEKERIRYAIRKPVANAGRIQSQQEFLRMAADGSQSYFEPGSNREPFAMLHRGV